MNTQLPSLKMTIEKKYAGGRITGAWITIYAVGSTADDAYDGARAGGCSGVSIIEIDPVVAAKAAARIEQGWKYLHHLSDGVVFASLKR